MKIQDIISQIKKLENELTKAMAERKEQNIQIYNATENAAKAYFDDVEEKKSKVGDRISELEVKKQEVSANIKNLQPQLVYVTAHGKKADIDDIQKRLTEMKAAELAIAEQIEMLETAEINGETSLYDTVNEHHNRLLSDSDDLSAIWDEINGFSDKQKEFWESVERKTSSFIGPLNLAVRHGKESKTAQKVENHYNKNSDVTNSNEIERNPGVRNIETVRRGSYEG